MKNTIRIGTRGSELALTQTKQVLAALRQAQPNVECEIRTIKTTGDRSQDRPIAELGATGVFTKEIEAALLANEIDIAIHSAKDLASTLPQGLIIGAVPQRLSPLDALISRDGKKLAAMKPGAIIGTGSPRRRAQALLMRPDIFVAPLRGNIDTRIKKVEDGEVDCAIIALAALERMGWAERAAEIFDADTILPAPGQGALAIQAREGDKNILKIIQAINHIDSFNCVRAERALLRELGAGCRTPIGGLAIVKGNRLTLKAEVLDVDGKSKCAVLCECGEEQPEQAGVLAAEKLLQQGAGEMIRRAQHK